VGQYLFDQDAALAELLNDLPADELGFGHCPGVKRVQRPEIAVVSGEVGIADLSTAEDHPVELGPECLAPAERQQRPERAQRAA
jgi:hypothetical protein